MRFIMLLTVLTLFACKSEDEDIDYELSGTWEYESVELSNYNRFIIKDFGERIEIIRCGVGSDSLLTEREKVTYLDSSSYHYKIVSNDLIEATGDSGEIYNIHKISEQTSFQNGSFSIYSKGIIDREYEVETCFSKTQGSVSSGNVTSPQINEVHNFFLLSSHSQEEFSWIRISALSLEQGEHDVGHYFWEDKVNVLISAPELNVAIGQDAYPSSGVIWVDENTDNQLMGGGIVELSEVFDHKVIEFTFNINY